MRMVLAWKNAHRSLEVTLKVIAVVCELLPSVSENARNSASTAISSAIFLLRMRGMFGVLGVFQIFMRAIVPSRVNWRDDDSKARTARKGSLNMNCDDCVTRADGRWR